MVNKSSPGCNYLYRDTDGLTFHTSIQPLGAPAPSHSIGSTAMSWTGTGSLCLGTATTAVAAGTVIDIDNIKAANTSTVASTGTIAGTNTSNPGLSNDSEVVYAWDPGSDDLPRAIQNKTANTYVIETAI